MTRWELVLAALAAWAWRGDAQPVERPSCPPDAGLRCSVGGSGQNEYTYTVDGLRLLIQYTDGGYFALNCPKNLTLDNPALPRFKIGLRVNKAQLTNCPLARDSYDEVLRRLNVTVSDKLKLDRAGLVSRAALAALHVPALELAQLQLAPGALAALGLRRLLLDRVRLPPEELLRLPATLETLVLTRMRSPLPAAVLERLPALANLTVRDSDDVAVALTASLRAVALEMPRAHVASALPGSLRSLTVVGWAERRPAPWSGCGPLRSLDVRFAALEALPAAWLRDCAELRVLRVRNSPLSALHATALQGAQRLQELSLAWCALKALPARLLDDAEQLSVLDLAGNRLTELPSGLFARTKSLQSLDLSKNLLTTSVYSSLAAVTSLMKLDLSFNSLNDSCGGALDSVRGTSPIQYLKKLTHLYLRRTNTSLICRDWRENMSLLEKLDLSNNTITSLTFADLQFRGSADVKLNLLGNNVTRLHYERRDYAAVLAGERSRADVTLDPHAALHCDCRTYWAARALRERPAHVRLAPACRALGPLAAGPLAAGPLAAAPLDALVCAEPALCAGAPRACSCAWRPGAPGSPGAPGAPVLRVDCPRGNLSRVAQALAPVAGAVRGRGAAPEHFRWQLYLPHNRIAELSDDDFPPYLSVLDLSDNELHELGGALIRAVAADPQREVYLAGNPLVCDCAAADAVRQLHVWPAALADYYNVTCRAPTGRTLLARARLAACAPRPGAAALAAAAALLALAAAAALAALYRRPALRRRLKAALRRRGRPPPDDDERDDAGRRFDVFLSFSHGDERFVREELVARLESGPAPYRLCVHYRDWVPGGWIPAQIAASVRASRRTVAVVSEHFLRSSWARAELQEAYALALREARPRLVVLLLDAPERLPLDARLRGYLATNTYVRWGDPWFWEKLRLALPPPAAPLAPLATSSCSEPSSSEPSSPESTSSELSVTSSSPAPELSQLMPRLSCGAQAAAELAPPLQSQA